MLEQVADAADDQLHRALRQNARFDHHPERRFGQVGGGGRRFDDRRDAGEQRRREFLEHPPDREVEGVDVHRHALERGVDMLADEGAALRQRLDRAVEQHMRVGKLAAALRREGEEGAGAALDVDPAVLAGRAGLVVELVQLLLARHDRLAERFQHPRALVEGQLAQRRAADLAGVAKHAGEIDAAGAGHRHRRAVDRADQLGQAAFARDPASERVVEQLRRFHRATPVAAPCCSASRASHSGAGWSGRNIRKSDGCGRWFRDFGPRGGPCC